MSALAAVQRRMHDALVRPAADPAAQALFASDGRLGAVGGLAIYQRGYFLRIAACMRAQFPALCHALGAALFDDFVADYIRDCPPERHTLYDLGRRFAGWMAANRPDGGGQDGGEQDGGEQDGDGQDGNGQEPWIDFMIDLARFEYAVFVMFDAEGHEGRPFATTETPDAMLRLQPAFALGRYRFPVADYYHAVRRGENPPLPAPTPLRLHVALVRTDYVIRTVPLSETHHAFLAAMQVGGSVDEALTDISVRFGLDPEEAGRSWRAAQGSRERWIAWGFFIPANA